MSLLNWSYVLSLGQAGLLQEEGGNDLLGFIGIDEAAADLEAVIAADEFVMDELAAAVGVFDKGDRVAVRAVAGDACGIG